MSFIKDYFTFPKKERGGIISLLVIMFLSIGTYFLIGSFSSPSKYDYSEFKNEIEAFESTNNRAKQNSVYHQKSDYSKYPSQKKQSLFKFNPNTISRDSLQLLGIYPNICDRIVKYRSKGAKFNSPEDLKKVYGVSDKLFKKLQPFISIPKIENNNSSETSLIKSEGEKLNLRINLNTADTTELKSVKGIGSKLSNRIIKFRDNAGGFYSLDQLKDIYGLKPELIAELSDKLFIEGEVKKININKATAEELKNHPYIYKWNIANAIVNYRLKHGSYKQAADLMKTDLVSEEICRKIAPYLVFE